MNFQAEIAAIYAKFPFYDRGEFRKKVRAPFYIYGAGFMGAKIYDLFTGGGQTVCSGEQKVLGFFETNCEAGKTLFGAPIISPVYRDSPVVVISSFKYFSAMRERLLELGYDDEHIVSPLGVFEEFYQKRFETAFNLVDDELSKKIVIDKIKYLTWESAMEPVSAYFDGEMFGQRQNEVFVDGGAFDGETSLEFIRIFNGQYKKIYCFEPTKANYDLAVKNLQNYSNVELVNKGLYSGETILKFKDFGVDQWNAVNDYYMDHAWNGLAMEYNLIEIPVTSLDIFFEKKPVSEYPTMIKLDIEGSEKEALLGMRRVINTSHPKLIICAYHKIEDYFELTETIRAICPKYKIKLRHYTDNVFESILFCQYDE